MAATTAQKAAPIVRSHRSSVDSAAPGARASAPEGGKGGAGRAEPRCGGGSRAPSRAEKESLTHVVAVAAAAAAAGSWELKLVMLLLRRKASLSIPQAGGHHPGRVHPTPEAPTTSPPRSLFCRVPARARYARV